MTFLFPALALALAAAVAWMSQRREDAPARATRHDLLALAIVAILTVVLALFVGPEADRAMRAAGLLGGMLATAIASLVGRGIAGQIAWGVAAAACCALAAPPGLASVQLTLVVGAGVASVVVGSPATTVAAAAIVSADRLGALIGTTGNLPFAGTGFGLLVLLLLLIRLSAPAGFVWPLSLLPIAGGYALGAFWLHDASLATCIGAGGIAGLTLALLLPREDVPTSFAAGLAAVIAVALATVAFAIGRAAGMALALASALGVAAVLANPRVLLPLGPMLGLVLFRVFRETYPETARAFDIGQHYALIGLIAGAVLPLVFDDWRRARPQGGRASAASGVWAIVLVLLPGVLAGFLGAYGVVGFIVGCGLSGLLQTVRKERELMVLSVGSAMAALALLSYGWFGRAAELSRDEKIVLLGWSALGLAVAAAIVTGLTRQARTQTS